MKYAVAAVFVAAVVLFYGLGGNNELGQRGPPQPELLSERYRRMVKRAPKQYKVNIRKFRRTELQAIQEGDAFMAVGRSISMQRVWAIWLTPMWWMEYANANLILAIDRMFLANLVRDEHQLRKWTL